MKKHAKILVVMLVVGAAFSYLMVVGLREGSMYYLEVAEFTRKSEAMAREKIRINGAVVMDSIHYNTSKREMTFTLKDAEGPEEIQVIYHGAPPDLIDSEGVTIVAEGRYNVQDRIFVSDNLLVKCPSKYEKEDV
jgi:cytochrome c-type biogenesis protein CcmE